MNAPTTSPLAKFDADTLRGIETSSGALGAPRALFQPQTLGEAMEIAKLMAAGNFVPGHLRGKAGDCLAVVMQAARWGLDPFAVGNKTYFVNDRMAYEAQLVIAVLNTSGVLDGRLSIEWEQTDTDLICTVTGTLKADRGRPKAVSQEMSRVKVKNSPLWQGSPRQQLGYYTSRMWARLFAPEVLLGVYTTDEIEEMGVENARPIEAVKPTRKRVTQQARQEETAAETVINHDDVPAHDAETGEIVEEQQTEEEVARQLDAQTYAEMDGSTAEDEPAQDERAETVGDEKDWQPTLDAIERELDQRTTVIDVSTYWSANCKMFEDAPEGVQNRAIGLKNARIAELKAQAAR